MACERGDPDRPFSTTAGWIRAATEGMGVEYEPRADMYSVCCGRRRFVRWIAEWREGPRIRCWSDAAYSLRQPLVQVNPPRLRRCALTHSLTVLSVCCSSSPHSASRAPCCESDKATAELSCIALTTSWLSPFLYSAALAFCSPCASAPVDATTLHSTSKQHNDRSKRTRPNALAPHAAHSTIRTTTKRSAITVRCSFIAAST